MTEYIIRYKGDWDKLYENCCRELEDLGFVLRERAELKSIGIKYGIFDYCRDDISSDKKRAESLDDRIRIEENKKTYIMQ